MQTSRAISRIVVPFTRSASTGSGIASKYSKAVYQAALSQSPATLTKVQGELTAINNALKSNKDLSAFVSNPTLSAADRKSGLQALFKAGNTQSEITKNLLEVMSENGRLVETRAVIEGFAELVSKYKGELEVVVTSASPLPKDVLTRLEGTLKQSQTAQSAKSVKVTNKVNPGVLGGIVVDFGDKTIDLSVQSRVTKLNALLHESV
ncbi:ATP synthase F0 subcomplex subunit OSCP atp5 [Tulasnella sp. 418]|nr:ATP synthase F0 subcomplex subunit OSCP atp5 [Tulasnella sp. 418]